MQDYADFAMYNYTDKTLASTNTHNGMKPATSVFDPNYDKATQNFENRNNRGEIEYKVTANYDKSKGALTVIDDDTGKQITVPVESGGTFGKSPIPNGKYEILDHANNTNSFRLDAIDLHPRDDINQNTGTTHLRLHNYGKGRNLGCVGVCEENNEPIGKNWNSINSLISNTKTQQVSDNTQYYYGITIPEVTTIPIYPKDKTLNGSIKNFGTLNVTE